MRNTDIQHSSQDSLRGSSQGSSHDSPHGSSHDNAQGDDGLAVQEARPKLKKPPMYQVVLLNDDYTPMEFVVLILERFFSKDRAQATRIMMHVHTQGKGLCGIFTREIAETKVAQVNECARDNNHPLLCEMETT